MKQISTSLIALAAVPYREITAKVTFGDRSTNFYISHQPNVECPAPRGRLVFYESFVGFGLNYGLKVNSVVDFKIDISDLGGRTVFCMKLKVLIVPPDTDDDEEKGYDYDGSAYRVYDGEWDPYSDKENSGE